MDPREPNARPRPSSGIVGGLILLVPACILAGAVGTFHHAYWTLAYLRLVSRDVPDSQPAG